MNSVVMLAPGEACGAWVHVVSQRIGGPAERPEGQESALDLPSAQPQPLVPESQVSGPPSIQLEARAGQLVGIMGGSGSGKSTLLSILNGSMRPTFGSVKLMDVDIHAAPERVAGLIGHVPQEDVLVEELTVRENPFNAKLSLSHLSENDQLARVDEVLQQLGLWETRICASDRFGQSDFWRSAQEAEHRT